jgi:hypothetical protein
MEKLSLFIVHNAHASSRARRLILMRKHAIRPAGSTCMLATIRSASYQYSEPAVFKCRNARDVLWIGMYRWMCFGT